MTLRRALLAYVAGAALLGSRTGLPVLCPFRRLTGRACPACGLTRSIASASRGRLRRSVRENAAGLLLTVGVVLSAVGGAREPGRSPAGTTEAPEVPR